MKDRGCGGLALNSVICCFRLIFSVLTLAGYCMAQEQPSNRPESAFWIAFEKIDTPELSYAAFPYVDIFLMDGTGHHVRRLTTDHRSHNPAWSPTGGELTFLRNRRKPDALNTFYKGYDLFMAYRDFLNIPRDVFSTDVDGKTFSHVASVGPKANDVVWLPDGKRIAVRMYDRTAIRALVDLSGRFLPENEFSVPLKTFLRDGQPTVNGSTWTLDDLMYWVPPVNNFLPTLVVSSSNRFIADNHYPASLPSGANLLSGVRVVSLSGLTLRFPILAYDIAWSHDGKRIAYSTFSGEQKSILYASEVSDGDVESNRRALTDQSLDAHGPAWSQDNSRISFTGLWRDSSQIFVIKADGSKLIQISRNSKMSCYHVSWSPDGNWIVADCRENLTVMQPLTYELGGGSSIFLFDVSHPGKKPRQLTRCANASSVSCGARNPSFAPMQLATSHAGLSN
jgi:dipeptidyl aminopeptidase/acylaminoacyl peptidase